MVIAETNYPIFTAAEAKERIIRALTSPGFAIAAMWYAPGMILASLRLRYQFHSQRETDAVDRIETRLRIRAQSFVERFPRQA